MAKCKTCKYLMEPNHTCPTPEEIQITQALVSSAARAGEVFGDDELEKDASRQQGRD